MELKKVFNKRFESLDKSVRNLSYDKKSAIYNLSDYDHDISCMDMVGKDCAIKFPIFDCLEYLLILKNTENAPKEKYDIIYVDDYKDISLYDGKFHLKCTMLNYSDDNEHEFEITFDDIEANSKIYNAVEEISDDTPWGSLCDIADSIVRKAEFSENAFNEREIKAMPLIKELAMLSIFGCCNEYEDNIEFPVLSSYFRRYGAEKLLPALDKTSKKLAKDDIEFDTLDELYGKLNLAEYEPMYREIYAVIKESQEGYPNAVDENIPKSTTDIIKDKITERFNELGYSGSYPDFTNHGELKGLHFVKDMYDTYFWLNKKNVYSHIHCQMDYLGEDIEKKSLNIAFLCGTEQLKEDQKPTDWISCSFNCKGEKLLNRVKMDIDDISDIDFDLVRQYVEIAAKRAECAKLTKAERKMCGDMSTGEFLKLLFKS